MTHLADARTPRQVEIQREIFDMKASIIDKNAEIIRTADIDQPGQWAIVVGAAREAGLTKEILCKEFSCAWSTILRWQSAQTLPPIFTRNAMRNKLLELVVGSLDKYQSEAA